MAWTVLVVGCAGSALGAWSWFSYVSTLRRQSAAMALAGTRSVLDTSLHRDSDLISTVNAVIATRPSIDNAGLQTLLARLNVVRTYQGAFGFAYLEQVSAATLPAFESVTRRDPPLQIALPASDSEWTPSRPASSYCLPRLAVAEVPPAQGLLPTLLASGFEQYLSPRFDYCTSTFAPLLHSSARTGQLTVTSLASLIGGTGGGGSLMAQPLHSFLAGLPLIAILSPVYVGNQIPTTGAERAADLRGWVLGLFDATEILNPVFASEPNATIALRYANPGARPEVLVQAGPKASGTASTTLTFAGDPGWSVRIVARPATTGLSPLTQGVALLVAGLVLSVLLAILVDVLARSRRSALVLVEQRTAELRHQALHDSLTGLPNRLLTGDHANQLLALARSEQVPIAAFFIDLDDFKKVNDTLGHGAGDQLLQALAVRLSQTVRASDTVGRLGGDEFVVLVAGAPLAAGLDRLAERLQSLIREPFRLGPDSKTHVALSASIGIAAGPRDSPEDLLRDADIALYRAKAMGKGCHVVFEPEMHEAVKQKLALEGELHDAFERHEFFLVYQPIVDLQTGVSEGVEALLRWRRPDRGVIGPDEFVPALEASDLIVDVGRYVLRQACLQAKAWHDIGTRIGVSVNVAARQLHYDALVNHVREALEVAGLEPRYLTVELTESMLMIDSSMTAKRLRALKRLGVRIAIDDFGAGFSSLSYLREFPVDILKIDRSFVARLQSEDGRNFLDALIHLGRSLGLVTIAEGIEEPFQLEHLRSESCDLGQGYLFARPLAAEAVRAALAKPAFVAPAPSRPLPSLLGNAPDAP